jgi:hypothetical protein
MSDDKRLDLKITEMYTENEIDYLPGDKAVFNEYINGWVIIFAFINILMGISSLSTLQKVSATEERIAKTNLEMVKIRIALERRDGESGKILKRINTVEEQLKRNEELYKNIEDRLEAVENRLK